MASLPHTSLLHIRFSTSKDLCLRLFSPCSSISKLLYFSLSVRQMEPILLHGTLHATIFEAKGLTNPSTDTGCVPRCLGETQMELKRRFMKGCSWIKRVSLCRPKQLVEDIEDSVGIAKGMTRLYATVDLEKARVGRTRIIQNDPANPHWNESFHIYCAHMATDVIFTIKNDNPVGATLIGRAYVPVSELLYYKVVEAWVDICDDHRQPVHQGSQIHVKLQFHDITQDSNWSQGIRSPKFTGVPYTFFSQKQGCRVTLYQDAHVPDNFIPKIPLAGGKYYEPKRCWEDIFDAITNARHLIYITGWSVYTEITLIRDPRRLTSGKNLTLGELLKRKAAEGVTVLMLVWDDRTSFGLGLLKRDGLMATHDQNTADYFHGTSVHCVLCPRNPGGGTSEVQDVEISTMFTHHQKTLVVDSEIPGRKSTRRIVSFVGGIDLCDGRYDTQFHSLFGTLDSAHKNDFHQPNFPNSSIKKGGPREPWHDIHCRLEGPVAWDVLSNFDQRWKKQGGNESLLLPLNDLAGTIIPPSPVTSPKDTEQWNVQVFRSIDHGAAFGFPKTPDAAAQVGLVSGKDNIIDRSIQDAYINAIRRAKDFIYIENQYFLGSSFGWKEEGIKVEDIGALHLVPKELSLKIVSKIEAGQRFAVYVVVPMWPEGVPESASVQAILDWQRRTMEMMYSDIANALRERGLNASPKEYLTFFCLANREVKKSGEYTPTEQPEPDSDYSRAQQARRFMIYVHSKMMIVDDEYIIIGSANINQRSMDGARDTEIAMGAYQPYHLATGQPARGQIHGFRMALWYEHLRVNENSFLWPQNVECIRKVNEIADRYWNLYISEKLEKDLPGHLLSYPIGVTNHGQITQLPGMNFFPDTKARILGTKSDYLPSILTT